MGVWTREAWVIEHLYNGEWYYTIALDTKVAAQQKLEQLNRDHPDRERRLVRYVPDSASPTPRVEEGSP